ncbi:MAG: manganese ABC transporter permease [Phototrophicales bacterium]|nr:MAG: manganese ABC transporter permease [Phototrophicales bacterium]RMG71531.1 MAG: metal ABC transporter permease [Chloroflexota bacterium]
MSLQEIFLDPLSREFMQRAIIAALLVGAISGVVGAFVVVRGMSFFGDALAHSVLPGVAVAYIYGGGAAAIPIVSDLLQGIEQESLRLFVGGLMAGIFAALLIGWMTRDERLKDDTAIGVIFVAMFALGLAIISTDERAWGRDLLHILFGNILAVQDVDIYIMLISGVVVIGTILLFYKELLLVSFDVALARSLRLPSEGLRTLLLILIAVTIVASLQTVGIVLMLAMLITPAATAQLITKRMHHLMIVAALIGAFSGVGGAYLAWHLQIQFSPAIVLILTGTFGVSFITIRLTRYKFHNNFT